MSFAEYSFSDSTNSTSYWTELKVYEGYFTMTLSIIAFINIVYTFTQVEKRISVPFGIVLSLYAVVYFFRAVKVLVPIIEYLRIGINTATVAIIDICLFSFIFQIRFIMIQL
jgi:hypothetical protein